MDFLTNNICTLKVLNKQHLLKKGVNILVSVFFKRSQYYKNFAIYVKGLEKVLKFVDEHSKDFVYVLFIDSHISEDSNIMSMINKCKNCVPVLFGCSEYMTEGYHTDLFGTLIRFFPMFDFDNNPCNIVICIDIDLHSEDYVRLKSIMEHNRKGVTAAGDIVRHIYLNMKPYIYGGLICYNREKMNKNLILNFIKNADKIESKGHYGKRLTTFGYGIDEIFVNDYFLPKIGEVLVVIDYQPSYFLFHSSSHILAQNRIDKSLNILSLILGSYDDKTLTAEEKIKKIDDLTYQVREKTDQNDEISRRLTMVVDHLVSNKKIWLEKPVLQFMNSHLKNVISANLYINYSYENNAIISVKRYNAVYDTDHESDKKLDFDLEI